VNGRALRAGLCAAAAISVPALAIDEPPQGQTVHCIHDGVLPSSTERLVGEAIRVLEQSGHSSADYRIELRMEDPLEPDDPDPRRQRVRSVVFVPRQPGERYVLRIHPSAPCAALWVWEPDQLTDWQRSVIERARETVATMLAEGPAVRAVRIRVVESRDLLRVEIDEAGPPAAPGGLRRFSVTLSRIDLRPLRGSREQAPAETIPLPLR